MQFLEPVDALEPQRSGANVALVPLDTDAWSGDTDVAVNVVATRMPESFSCQGA